MNLQRVAFGLTAAVNPPARGLLQTSAGSTEADDGSRVPKYDPIVEVFVDVQPLETGDIQRLDGLNLQGKVRKVYIQGKVDGLVRSEEKGGDLLTITDGPWNGVWLVNMVFEQWPSWASVAATLQNEPIPNG